MAKEPSGKSKPDQAESPPNQDKEREEYNSSKTTPETEGQAELPLGEFTSKKSTPDPKLKGTPEIGRVDESAEDVPAEPTEATCGDDLSKHTGEEDHNSNQDEYHDDHYGYHEENYDQYHDDHYGYHEEHHDAGHHDDQHRDSNRDDPYVFSGGGYDGGMADDPTEDDEFGEEGESYGGPVKPFLDHLEDFRWMLLKIFATVAIGMVVSLVAAPNIMSFLTKPMEWARDMEYIKLSRGLDNKFVPVRLGSKQITTLKGNELKGIFPNSNATYRESIMEIQLVPDTNRSPVIGQSKQVLTLVAKTQGRTEAPIPEAKYYGVIDPFMGAIKLAIFGGIFISIPFLLYFIGDFVLPALKNREKQLIYWIVGGGTCLFLAGAAFCYFILLKITMLVSVSFAHMLGFGADEWRADNLIGFVAKFTLGMGLAFQMPMVILSLVKIGFVDDRGLAKFRSYAVVINLILAAMITPTVDPFTMLLVAGPLQLLYEISLFVARYWRRRDETKEPDVEE